MYGVDVKSQRPPAGKTRYRFVLDNYYTRLWLRRKMKDLHV